MICGGCEVIQVIRTNLLLRGDGKATYLRSIAQYWTLAGELLWEHDPCPPPGDEVKGERTRMETRERMSRPKMSLDLDRNDAGWLCINQNDEPNGMVGRRVWLTSPEQLSEINAYARKEMCWPEPTIEELKRLLSWTLSHGDFTRWEDDTDYQAAGEAAK